MFDEVIEQAIERAREAAKEELARFNAAFEDRLASAMQKALDAVLYENEARLTQLEDDMGRVLRHLGMESE